jgi:hypothetical protein
MLVSVAKTITNPVFLFKIDFGSQYIYATSRETVSYGNNSYSTKGAKILSINATRLKFSLPNFDRSISALALAGQIQGNEVVVYLHYEGETIGRFTGLLDAPSISGDYNSVVISCVSEYALGTKWPNDRLRPPVANHLPPSGYVVEFSNVKITLERDRN